MLRRAKISVQPEAVNATSAQFIALIGDVAPYVKPSPEAPKQRQGGGRGNGGRRSR